MVSPLLLLLLLLLVTLSRPDTMMSPSAPPDWKLTDGSGRDSSPFMERAESAEKVMGVENVEDYVVVIWDQPGRRDGDTHDASPPFHAGATDEPGGQRKGSSFDKSQLMIPAGEEILLTETVYEYKGGTIMIGSDTLSAF